MALVSPERHALEIIYSNFVICIQIISKDFSNFAFKFEIVCLIVKLPTLLYSHIFSRRITIADVRNIIRLSSLSRNLLVL